MVRQVVREVVTRGVVREVVREVAREVVRGVAREVVGSGTRALAASAALVPAHCQCCLAASATGTWPRLLGAAAAFAAFAVFAAFAAFAGLVLQLEEKRVG